MTRRSRWLALWVSTGGVLLVNGCLGAFWHGLIRGWPPDNRWLNLAVDVLKEATIYAP